jgi:hypothetical protein
MKQYLLSVHMVDGQPPHDPALTQQMFADVDVFNQRMQDEGRWVFAGGLYPADVATVVRNEGGEVVTTDGPFAESKEHIGGFWVLQAEDLDDVLRLAADASKACHGPVEVRPFQDNPES